MKRVVMNGLVVVGLLVATSAQAAVRCAIVPKQGTGTIFNPIKAKYVADMGVKFDQLDFGKEDAMLICGDFTAQQFTDLSANLDVTAIPPLNTTVSSAALATVTGRLEGLKLPADWIVAGETTYRQVLVMVGHIFSILQKFDAMYTKTFFESGITLDTRINQLTNQQKTVFQSVVAEFGLDTTGLNGQTLIRKALKQLSDQMPPFKLCPDSTVGLCESF